MSLLTQTRNMSQLTQPESDMLLLTQTWSKIPLLQGIWNCILQYETWLRSPIFPVLFSLSVYLSFCSPFVLLDLLSSRVELVRRYKIQQKLVTLRMMWNCLALSLYNHMVYIFLLFLVTLLTR
ncbi:cholesterol 25-hydroxylase-like protein [Silurus meridionalis]|nr:cholesterol 25-hydroxylase-like protein [Silurus meridionalis]